MDMEYLKEITLTTRKSLQLTNNSPNKIQKPQGLGGLWAENPILVL